LIGFAYSPFRAHDLLSQVIEPLIDETISVAVYDGVTTDPSALLYATPNTPSSSRVDPLQITHRIDVAGQKWTMVYTTLSPIDQQSSIALAIFTTVGLILSIALFLFSRAQVRARQAALSAVSTRDLFFSVASHELRSPLTSLLGNAQLLQRRAIGSLNERKTRNLQVIVDQAKRLNRLILALLDHSRIQNGRLTLEQTPLDVVVLVREVIDEVSIGIIDHRITLSLPDQPLIVAGDAVRLGQVFHNLLNNAIKYSPDGGIIRVRISTDGISAFITIHDEGIGIPAEALPHLFTQFYRAPNAQSRNITGLGIGLFIIHEIIDLHGGQISAESTEGAGSTFTVQLPLQHAIMAIPGYPTTPANSPR
jgi:signal transduction histidine kinase